MFDVMPKKKGHQRVSTSSFLSIAFFEMIPDPTSLVGTGSAILTGFNLFDIDDFLSLTSRLTFRFRFFQLHSGIVHMAGKKSKKPRDNALAAASAWLRAPRIDEKALPLRL
jgi:hypothetical protein